MIFLWDWGLLKESVNVLLETAPKGINIDIVNAKLKENMPEIVEITDMHIWEITSEMYSLTAHITVKEGNSKQIISKINKLLNEKYGIEHTTIQLEEAESSLNSTA